MFESFILIFIGLALKKLAHYCYYQVTAHSIKPEISFSLAPGGLKIKLSLTTTNTYGATTFDVTIPIPASTIFIILGWIYSLGDN